MTNGIVLFFTVKKALFNEIFPFFYLKLVDYFKDVDLLPEDERNIYSCPEQKAARHVSKFNFRKIKYA